MKNNNKGFTLIELLAVIIILGILLIIAIPSVTTYISNTRKEAYIDTARELIGSAKNIVNKGELETYSTDAIYYIPANCIPTETGISTPYGELKEAYVGVTYNGSGYDYYWISVDSSGQGINEITPYGHLNADLINSNVDLNDVKEKIENTSVDGRKSIIILNDNSGIDKLDNEIWPLE